MRFPCATRKSLALRRDRPYALAMFKKAYNNWRSRHRNKTSFALHMVGIPACFVAAPIFLVTQMWWWALAAFVGGYALQFLGHAIERNRSGEELLIRRLLGMNHDQPGKGGK